MFVVILGCSEVGYHLTKALLATGHEVVVIEKDQSRCQLLTEELGSVVQQGDGTDEMVLKQAGASRADVFVAVTGRDETNLVACQVTKHVFQVPRTMAVLKDPKNEPVFHLLGVDVVVNATHQVLTSLEEGIPGRPMLHLMNLGAAGMELVSLSIPDDAGVVGRRLEEVELPPHSVVSLVIKKSGAQLTSHELVLEAEDQVVAATMTGEEQTLYDILTGV